METDPEEKAEWDVVRELFLDIAELEGEAQAARLSELETQNAKRAARVRQLLGHDTEPTARILGRRDPASPEVFGPYRAIRQIGTGGMGEVYLAKRVDGEFEREVAIKRLHPGTHGEQLVQRFLRERQTLARLDHEYIARLIDGGTSNEGEPYLVLEYVEGRHIDVFCREEALDVRARLELFIKVLKAVQYAHNLGVIHRDLKPSNVLVRADGQPRLLDFGIARALETELIDDVRLTGTGQRLFTPEFASPEQVRGDTVGKTSDVFSLGVILYHLLCDAGPWEGSGSMHELERRILDSEPLPPSRRLGGTARRALSGDLDTVVLGCLAKNPSGRMESVAILADELDRYLNGLPIRTRATGVFGRTLRHVRRKPWQALAAVTLISAALIGTWAWRSDQLAQVSQVELIESLAGRIVQARNLLGQDRTVEAARELNSVLGSLKLLPAQEELELEALVELCKVYLRQRREPEVLPLLERAFGLRPKDPAVWVTAQVRLLIAASSCYRITDTPEVASEAAAVAYAYALKWLRPGDSLRLEAIDEYAGQSGSALDLEQRLGILEDALKEAEGIADPNDPNIANLQVMRGNFLGIAKRYDEALESFDVALTITRWHLGEGHGDVAQIRDLRAITLVRLGRLEEAVTEFDAILKIFESLGHKDKVALVYKHQGELLRKMGEYSLSVEALSRSHDVYREQLGPDDENCREILSLMGLVQVEGKLWADAAESFRAALEPVDGRVVLKWGFEAQARARLSGALLELGDPRAAYEQAELALAIAEPRPDAPEGMVGTIRRLMKTAQAAMDAESDEDEH